MKRKMIALIVGVLMLWMGFVGAAQAQVLVADAAPMTEQVKTAIEQFKTKLLSKSDTSVNPFEQLQTQILPQLESILTPEQRQQLDDAIANGTSPKKAFKSIALTPDQKTKLGTMMKSLPKDFFTSLTPAQKKELFMKKRDFFINSKLEGTAE